MSRQKLWLFSLLNLLVLALLTAWFWSHNRPAELLEPHLPWNQKLQCVSYAPYYTPGTSPFVPGTHISPAQIEQDLALLAERFDCVRTYSVGQGLDYVPEAASKLGLEVLLGVWIGWTEIENDKELTLAIALARERPEVIRALVVGNEVLLRQEQPPEKLRAYIKRARDYSGVPVTYADVWEFWLKNRMLENEVDFVTAHILPYWEDDPQSIDNAVAHATTVMHRLGETFEKPILIGETGWPSAGRHRDASAPGLVNQARYIREFLQAASDNGWNYNLIEAFDQPWKRVLEGTVGGHWGLYNSSLQAKFALSGPVAERNDGRLPLYAALGGILVFSLLALRATGSTAGKPANALAHALLAFAPLGAAAGLVACLQMGYLSTACRDLQEWFALGGLALAGWLGLLALPAFMLQASNPARRCIQLSLWLLAISALIASLLLLFDGRYRDFPISLFVLPAIVFGLVLGASGISIGSLSRHHANVMLAAFMLSLGVIWFEPQNHHAWAWLTLTLLLAFAGRKKRQNFSSSQT
jgi:exo-beta-1,3-glucanase (GH17 family)